MQNFEARVVSCLPAEPVQGSAGTQAAWEVLLDQTAFYPTSGGQPNDLGLLGEATVLDVRDEDEEVVHIVDREMEPGRVTGCVNWPRRFDHMQQHTGQHLLSAMFQERFGLPTVSFHLGRTFARSICAGRSRRGSNCRERNGRRIRPFLRIGPSTCGMEPGRTCPAWGAEASGARRDFAGD